MLIHFREIFLPQSINIYHSIANQVCMFLDIEFYLCATDENVEEN